MALLPCLMISPFSSSLWSLSDPVGLVIFGAAIMSPVPMPFGFNRIIFNTSSDLFGNSLVKVSFSRKIASNLNCTLPLDWV